MSLQFLGIICSSKTVLRISVKQAFDKVSSLGCQSVPRESNLAESDVLVHLLGIICVEWTPATAHLEHQYTQGPEIYHFCVSLLVQENFRSKILGSTTEGIGCGILG